MVHALVHYIYTSQAQAVVPTDIAYHLQYTVVIHYKLWPEYLSIMKWMSTTTYSYKTVRQSCCRLSENIKQTAAPPIEFSKYTTVWQ